jgi:sterol desaturase/sphingolipid hydroxylase (fatty acid hydroxylase superfamily)
MIKFRRPILKGWPAWLLLVLLITCFAGVMANVAGLSAGFNWLSAVALFLCACGFILNLLDYWIHEVEGK